MNKPQESNGDSSQAAEQVIHVPLTEIFLGVRRKTNRFPFAFKHIFSTGPLVVYNIRNIINENLSKFLRISRQRGHPFQLTFQIILRE